jgi:hypothetical protein
MFSRLLPSGFRFPLVIGLCCMLAAACATTPRSAEQDGPIEDGLPPGAAIYGFVSVQHMEPFIQSLLPEQFNNKQTTAFIKKTDWAVFGIYRVAREEKNSAAQSVFLITGGNYPAFSYNFGFALSPGWKSVAVDGRKWWRQDDAALSMGKNRAYIRLGDIPVPDVAVQEPGALFADAHRTDPSAVFAAYIPSSEASGFIRSVGIPLSIALENITLQVVADGAAYRSTLSLKTKSPSEAKALSAILSLARLIAGNRAAPGLNADLARLIFANPPTLNDSTITVTGEFPMESLVSSVKQLNFFPQ